jgi:hypothetical protein
MPVWMVGMEILVQLGKCKTGMIPVPIVVVFYRTNRLESLLMIVKFNATLSYLAISRFPGPFTLPKK